MSIDKLHKKLIKKKTTISVVESCTGGLLSSNLTKLSGSSKYFKMGLITYSNNSKINILNVNKEVIDKYGAVSHECCKSMVENLSKLSKVKSMYQLLVLRVLKVVQKINLLVLYLLALRENKIFIIKNLFGKKKRSIIQNNTVKKCINLLIKFI